MQRIGEKLRDLRKKNNLTIKELSNLIGYNTHSHISEFETGKRTPPLDFLLKISNLFNVPVDLLVKDELDLE
ncbi:helix-turn-helix transcriptional regulator [candidate division KSB1 bacterium]|nr:helix-turn-helix transcriptional regulator [candidate division KSB1 bacterium]